MRKLSRKLKPKPAGPRPSKPIRTKERLIYTSTVQYGEQALILEVVHHNSSSSHHNSGIPCSLCGCTVQNVKKSLPTTCISPAQNVSWPGVTAFPEPLVG